MNVRNIVYAILALVVVYLVYVTFFADSSEQTLVHYHDAKRVKNVAFTKMPKSYSNDFTYSLWFYINNWNYRYGTRKVIFERKDESGAPCPSVVLDPTTNNLEINLAVYHNKKTSASNIHTCTLLNVPIQKWCNLIISLENRALDVYLDGKLVKTCILHGVAKNTNTSDVKLTPNGGFSGYLSKFKYIRNAVTPSEAYDIYKAGFGSSGTGGLGNLFNKYRIKFAFVEDNKEVNSFEL